MNLVSSQMAKIQNAANRSLADWHSFSWKEFEIKNPPTPRQLHTMVTHEDCLVCKNDRIRNLILFSS